MRLISFALTPDQLLAGFSDDPVVRAAAKTVTRRVGWASLKAGERLLAVRKAMGLKKGESPEVLCEIEVVSVRRERLDFITASDCAAEGFPNYTPRQFVEMFCRHMSIAHPDERVWSDAEQRWERTVRPVRHDDQVTRIEFRVVPGTRRVPTQSMFVFGPLVP